VPKLRKGSYFPSLLEPRRRAERALLSVVQEAYVQGVSTRKVEELVKSLGLEGVSKSEVSRICEELEEVVERFRNCPLISEHPYVLCVTGRQSGGSLGGWAGGIHGGGGGGRGEKDWRAGGVGV
jgi:hypothetical protein